MLNEKGLVMLLISMVGLDGCCSYSYQLSKLRWEKEQDRDKSGIRYGDLEYIYFTKYKIDNIDIAPLLTIEF